LEKEKQEKILSQQQETESFFELDTVIPVNTVNTVNIVDTIDTKDSMDNLHTVNTIDTKIDTVIPIGLGGLVITGIIAYLVSKK
jgi:tRNA A22 N-methylase